MNFEFKNKLKLLNTGLLLVPGFLYSCLTLIISSNRLSFINPKVGLYLLNISLLLALGVTLSKYAADQMLLAKLKINQRVSLKLFFYNRVFPIIIIYVGFLFFTQKLITAILLLICLPIEVFAIISVIEMNVSKRYFQALYINLLGYPSIFLIFLVLSFFTAADERFVIALFASMAFLKLMLVLYSRNKGEVRDDILILSARVPLQQAGNYLLFRFDQVFIALNVIPSLIFSFSIPQDYLFYSKFVDVFSGVATSLSPIIIGYAQAHSTEISFKPILKNKLYILISISAIMSLALFSYLFLKDFDLLHLLLIVPFAVSILMIVPVNLINYELYRRNDLKRLNEINFKAFIPSLVLISVNLYFKSTILFAFIVPLQLFSFFILQKTDNKKRRDVI